MSAPERVALYTHRAPEQTSGAVAEVASRLGAAGTQVLIAPDEAEKHGLESDGVTIVDRPSREDPQLAIVLGGDGTMLAALREFAGTEVPVFAFNFGAVGFLATVDRDDLDDGIRRVLEGDYAVIGLPALEIEPEGKRQLAVNDVTFQRHPGQRVAELAYLVDGEMLGQVRCDGLVASTPVGSTGYNLANGGPVLAWGVRGVVVSFIAPHTLTARTLVIGTDDVLTVRNLSSEDPVDVDTDGRRVCTLKPRDDLEVRFVEDQVRLAQCPGRSFYSQLREKFGRLAY